jgi:uncharacterized protein YyaL (SSP411 family)
MATHTLTKMARGYLRPSGRRISPLPVDAKWLVPHFEKMLYDNAQLIRCYARLIK